MLRITKQTDYGIVLLSRMAAEPARPLVPRGEPSTSPGGVEPAPFGWGMRYNAPELAAEVQLPLPTVSKILKLLARDGLLLSHRGVKGGYSLARPPERITVAQIIACLEGPIAMTECIEDGTDECLQEGHCAMQANWQVINRAVRAALEGITLRDMAEPLPQELVQLGAYRVSIRT